MVFSSVTKLCSNIALFSYITFILEDDQLLLLFYLGITTKEASLELGNQVDDDIMRFLDNFPLGVPVPDWCDDQQNTSNAQSFECDQIQLSKSSSWRLKADSDFEVYRFLQQL